MSKIRIKNFGPIKEGYLKDDGFLDIKKVTVFIGNQGSGKSTVAKVISLAAWWEKRLNRIARTRFSSDTFKDSTNFQGISEYLNEKTQINYSGEKIDFEFSEKETDSFKIQKKEGINFITPKIMYIPAERNTLTTIEEIYGVTGMPKHLLAFSEELRRANDELKSKKIKLPINDYLYDYNEITHLTYIIGKDYEINISNASSGIQSLAPLYIVSRNLAELVTQADEKIRENLSAESISLMNEELRKLEANDSIPENEKIEIRKGIKAKYLPKCFINIVEEPEQNLYPSSQRHILNSLLEFNNMSVGNKLIMTTHSPYILSFLTLAIKAGLVYEQLKTIPGAEGLIEELDKIVPVKSLIQPDDLAIYQIDDNGTISKLETYKGLPSDDNYLNGGLEEANELFSQLLDLEKSCRIL